MTTIAVWSDLHGNTPAMLVLLAELDRVRPDLVVNLGDIASGAVDPRGTMEALARHPEFVTVRGNHERQLATRDRTRLGASDALAADTLSSGQLAWLGALPARLEVVPGVLAFHGTPADDRCYLLETVEPGGLREATDEEVIARLGEDAGRYDVYLCGHSHLQRTRRLPDGTLVVNPGSMGWPASRAPASLAAARPSAYLEADDVVQSDHPEIARLARELRAGARGDAAFTAAAYEWVRDRVTHSVDAQDPRVTVTATEVLAAGTGLCYAKAHLLAALLRAQGIPAGLCYQRLADEAGSHVLHGLVAVHLDGRWHRLDPRGNNGGVDAHFTLYRERLAFVADPAAGEVDYPDVLVRPAPAVLAALRGSDDVLELCRTGLPASLG